MALVFILLTVSFTVAGQLLVKQGMLEVGASPSELSAIPAFVLSALLNVKVVLGLSFAMAAAISWIFAISRSKLSFAYPFMSLALVLVLALTPIFFDEQVSLGRWVGVLLVVAGIWLSAVS